MKRFLSILAVSLLLLVCLFAEPKITEKQLDDFMENGTYIKFVSKNKNGTTDVSYVLKQNIAKLYLSDEVMVIFNVSRDHAEHLQLDEWEISFVNHNIIFTLNAL